MNPSSTPRTQHDVHQNVQNIGIIKGEINPPSSKLIERELNHQRTKFSEGWLNRPPSDKQHIEKDKQLTWSAGQQKGEQNPPVSAKENSEMEKHFKSSMSQQPTKLLFPGLDFI